MNINRVVGLVFSGFTVKAAAIALALIVASEASSFVAAAFAPIAPALSAIS